MQPTTAPWAKPVQGTARSALPANVPIIEAEASLPSVEEAVRARDSAGNAPSFRPPKPCITSQAALTKFLKSSTAKSFVGFILALNDSVKGKKLSDECHESDVIKGLSAALQQLSHYVDEIPPVQAQLRYGNPAYKDWFDRMVSEAPALIQALLPDAMHPATEELLPYFVHSFGNRTRVDYGTGHETTFCAFLYCLAALGVVQQQDCQALVTRVYANYLQLMRKVQTTYWLEPAGSHGVWGLDDYQFLSFIWGSSQLINHPMIRPKSIHTPDVLKTYAKEYMYLDCVQFVQQVKKGPLAETSPMINDISGVASWAKVNSGMVKMYEAELLAKLPIMQHFLFGSLLPFPQDE